MGFPCHNPGGCMLGGLRLVGAVAAVAVVLGQSPAQAQEHT
jgi:hypothetical protein